MNPISAIKRWWSHKHTSCRVCHVSIDGGVYVPFVGAGFCADCYRKIMEVKS